MDWVKYGTYDTPAAVREIRKRNNDKKVALVGHSQGTTQTFAGMGTIPEWYDANISVAALMGPCTSPNTAYFKDFYTKDVWECIEAQGVTAFDSPTWDIDGPKLDAACSSTSPVWGPYFGYLSGFRNTPSQALAHYA